MNGKAENGERTKVAIVASAMRQRADDFSRRANSNLVLGMLMLVAGLPLFIYSGSFGQIIIDSLPDPMIGLVVQVTSATVVRIAIVMYMIFVAKVFLQLYRTALQYVVFYHSQADALSLINDDELDILNSLSGLLYPKAVAMESLPESPTKEVLEMLERVAQIAKSK